VAVLTPKCCCLLESWVGCPDCRKLWPNLVPHPSRTLLAALVSCEVLRASSSHLIPERFIVSEQCEIFLMSFLVSLLAGDVLFLMIV